MAKYFCGITLNGKKYSVSILDDNLNIIFMDNLDFDKLLDLFKRKNISTISIDFPIVLYQKYLHLLSNKTIDSIKVKKRSCDNMLNSKGLLTYHDRFNVDKSRFESLMELYRQLAKLGFAVREAGSTEHAIIESYPDTSFSVLEKVPEGREPKDELIRRKVDLLKSKGIRVKDYFKRDRKSTDIEAGTLCQAFTAYLYYKNEYTCLGTAEEGLLILPVRKIPDIGRSRQSLNTAGSSNETAKAPEAKSTRHLVKPPVQAEPTTVKTREAGKITAEYCGAQYLYTNTDGVIRIDDLRPIKSYRPFTEIYQMGDIILVQVIIGTTDGLRKVKANLIPNSENSNAFKAADEEDRKKLDSFWGNRGDKRGYLIKFNRVEVIKA
jgi:hypothetical protein